MKNEYATTNTAKVMSGDEFQRLSGYIYTTCGIKLPLAKKLMLEARLQKRLRTLGVETYGEYCDYLQKSPDRENECVHMIDCVTTNKTDFFREPTHFTFLIEKLLPAFLVAQRAEGARRMAIWSSACSTGEEPYTLAMILNEFAAQHPDFHFSVHATDISTRVLDQARNAVYPEEHVAPVPLNMKKKYLLRGKDREKKLVRIVPELRGMVQFQRLNLMENTLMPVESMDVIFCRNVIIYFDRETQYKLLERLCRCLRTGGHLFLGHSETIHGFELPLNRISSTIYKKLA
jgi:chemotaxis protein methyltransferase CheR